jgi:hypothetical protein
MGDLNTEYGAFALICADLLMLFKIGRQVRRGRGMIICIAHGGAYSWLT